MGIFSGRAGFYSILLLLNSRREPRHETRKKDYAADDLKRGSKVHNNLHITMIIIQESQGA